MILPAVGRSMAKIPDDIKFTRIRPGLRWYISCHQFMGVIMLDDFGCIEKEAYTTIQL